MWQRHAMKRLVRISAQLSRQEPQPTWRILNWRRLHSLPSLIAKKEEYKRKMAEGEKSAKIDGKLE